MSIWVRNGYVKFLGCSGFLNENYIYMEEMSCLNKNSTSKCNEVILILCDRETFYVTLLLKWKKHFIRTIESRLGWNENY